MAKAIKAPKTARVLREYRETHGGRSEVVLQLSATKSTFYVWEHSAWRRVSEADALLIASRIDALNEAAMAEADRKRRIWDFVSHAQELRQQWEDKAARIVWANAVEGEYLRRYVRAQTLDERLALRDERTTAIDALDDGVEMEEIPNPWGLEPRDGGIGQLRLKLRN